MADSEFPVSHEMLEQAGKALAKHHLCRRCLGRLFGRVGHGFTNEERGDAILQKLPEVPQSGPERCWLCDNMFDDMDILANLAVEKLGGLEFGSFLVGTRLTAHTRNREEQLWAEADITDGELLKSEFNREMGKLLAVRLGAEVDFRRPDIVIIVEPEYRNVEVEVNSIFFYGRYRKLIRGIPQTHWPCRYCHGKGCEHCNGTGKMYETSVEEIVAQPFLERTEGSGEHFHGMGREDIDARMLGNGRPFVLEITEPRKRTLNLDEVMEEVNREADGRVEVLELRYSEKDEVARIKQLAPPKSYRVTVNFEEGVDSERLKKVIAVLRGAEISQQTPKRVLHRRADRIRKRKVFSIEAVDLPETAVTSAVIEVKAQSGTYIKELMHGDGGRTEPSLAGLLGIPVVVESLDVIHIHDAEVQ